MSARCGDGERKRAVAKDDGGWRERARTATCHLTLWPSSAGDCLLLLRQTQRSPSNSLSTTPLLNVGHDGMENGAHKLLESATHRTLHAHNFARSSSQASSVLTDLLGRYLSLLLTTCSTYAEHAGRANLTPSDALGALQEMGMSLDDLVDYLSSEGRDLNRYAAKTARRVEDLAEFRG